MNFWLGIHCMYSLDSILIDWLTFLLNCRPSWYDICWIIAFNTQLPGVCVFHCLGRLIMNLLYCTLTHSFCILYPVFFVRSLIFSSWPCYEIFWQCIRSTYFYCFQSFIEVGHIRVRERERGVMRTYQFLYVKRTRMTHWIFFWAVYFQILN